MSGEHVMDNVRRALGRADGSLPVAPVPPALDEPIVRLVPRGSALVDLFTRVARQNQMSVEHVAPAELIGRLIAFLNAHRCKRIAMSCGGVTQKLGLAEALRSVGFTATSWNELTTDALYDYDCGITGASAAVAETGSIVLHGSGGGDRLLSLVPNVHVAIIEQRHLLPDLVDLFEKLSQESQPSPDTVIITGPSKTADIEMNLVTGVHGPGVVHVLLLS